MAPPTRQECEAWGFEIAKGNDAGRNCGYCERKMTDPVIFSHRTTRCVFCYPCLKQAVVDHTEFVDEQTSKGPPTCSRCNMTIKVHPPGFPNMFVIESDRYRDQQLAELEAQAREITGRIAAAATAEHVNRSTYTGVRMAKLAVETGAVHPAAHRDIAELGARMAWEGRLDTSEMPPEYYGFRARAYTDREAREARRRHDEGVQAGLGKDKSAPGEGGRTYPREAASATTAGHAGSRANTPKPAATHTGRKDTASQPSEKESRPKEKASGRSGHQPRETKSTSSQPPRERRPEERVSGRPTAPSAPKDKRSAPAAGRATGGSTGVAPVSGQGGGRGARLQPAADAGRKDRSAPSDTASFVTVKTLSSTETRASESTSASLRSAATHQTTGSARGKDIGLGSEATASSAANTSRSGKAPSRATDSSAGRSSGRARQPGVRISEPMRQRLRDTWDEEIELNGHPGGDKASDLSAMAEAVKERWLSKLRKDEGRECTPRQILSLLTDARNDALIDNGHLDDDGYEYPDETSARVPQELRDFLDPIARAVSRFGVEREV